MDSDYYKIVTKDTYERYTEIFDRKFQEHFDNNVQPLADKFLAHLTNGKKILDLGSGPGNHAVYFRDNSGKLDKQTEKNIQYIPLSSEKEVLKEFWDTAQLYDQFVTFNGRGFDCPFLIVRSAVHKIKPTKNLMPNRYESGDYGKIITHVDLLDRLTFFGSVRRKGNLHMWCQAFGIDSPKDKGITGDDVGQLYKDKKYLDIAQYCAGDLWATKELFNYWDKYIK